VKKPRVTCKNCGDLTTFTQSGDRTPDYERETLGWCRRCWRIASRDKDWPETYEALRKQRCAATEEVQP